MRNIDSPALEKVLAAVVILVVGGCAKTVRHLINGQHPT